MNILRAVKHWWKDRYHNYLHDRRARCPYAGVTATLVIPEQEGENPEDWYRASEDWVLPYEMRVAA